MQIYTHFKNGEWSLFMVCQTAREKDMFEEMGGERTKVSGEIHKDTLGGNHYLELKREEVKS